jgi:hypothetical protein
MLSLIEMNPPRGTRKHKKRRAHKRRSSVKPSPAQLRARAAFAAMARAKAKGRTRTKHTRKAKRRRVAVSGFATRRATTMPSNRKRRRSERRSGGAGGIARRAFAIVPFKKDMIPDVIGIAGGMLAAPKLVEMIGSKKDANGVPQTADWLKGSDGRLSPMKYMLAKLAAGAALATVLGFAKQHRIARAVAVGSLATAAYDMAIRQAPKLAPATLSGDDDMGFLRELPPGYGMNDMGFIVPIAQAA